MLPDNSITLDHPYVTFTHKISDISETLVGKNPGTHMERRVWKLEEGTVSEIKLTRISFILDQKTIAGLLHHWSLYKIRLLLS